MKMTFLLAEKWLKYYWISVPIKNVYNDLAMFIYDIISEKVYANHIAY